MRKTLLFVLLSLTASFLYATRCGWNGYEIVYTDPSTGEIIGTDIGWVYIECYATQASLPLPGGGILVINGGGGNVYNQEEYEECLNDCQVVSANCITDAYTSYRNKVNLAKITFIGTAGGCYLGALAASWRFCTTNFNIYCILAIEVADLGCQLIIANAADAYFLKIDQADFEYDNAIETCDNNQQTCAAGCSG